MEPRPGRRQDQSSLPTVTLSRESWKTGSARRRGALAQAEIMIEKPPLAFWKSSSTEPFKSTAIKKRIVPFQNNQRTLDAGVGSLQPREPQATPTLSFSFSSVRSLKFLGFSPHGANKITWVSVPVYHVVVAMPHNIVLLYTVELS